MAEPQGPAPVGQHGGRRANAGRKSASSPEGSSYALLAKAKAKGETYKAQLTELEYRQRIGELLPAAEVATRWADQVRIAKERLLGIPPRVAPAVLRMTELRDVERAIREALLAVLEELSSDGAG